MNKGRDIKIKRDKPCEHKHPDNSGYYANVCLKCQRLIWATFDPNKKEYRYC